MCGWRWSALTTVITEGVVLHGHRARAGAARGPAEADGRGGQDRRRSFRSAGGLLPETWREHCDARAGGLGRVSPAAAQRCPMAGD